MFTNLRARFWKGLCYARAFVKLVDYHVRTLQQVNKQIVKTPHFIQRDCNLNNDNNAHGTIF